MEALRETTFRALSQLMHEAIGVHFTPAKMTLVASRLGPRIQKLGLGGYDDYLGLISGAANSGGSTGGEFQMAVDLLTTNETYFFREPAHYTLIEQEIVRTKPLSLSVWSAASSFGDEAYSTAMLLADLQQRGALGSDWRILGTDISDRVLRSAVEAASDDEGWSHLGSVGQQIGNQASFDSRNYGYRNLSGLIEAIGLFEIKWQGQIVWVREEKKARVAKKT